MQAMVRAVLTFVLLAGLGWATPARAQSAPGVAEFPNRTVRLLVPFAAGGGVDLLARLIGQRLSVLFGKPVVVENHTGATGLVAAQLVGASAGDGYTLLVGTPSTMTVLLALKGGLPFNNLADFMPITLLGTAPFVLVVNPKVEAKTIRELIALAQASPGKFNFGNAGARGMPHLASLMFQQMAGIELVHVPFRGTAPAMTAVVAGQVDGMIDSMISQLPAIGDGRLRALGVGSMQSTSLLPNVPPIAGTLPGYTANVVLQWSAQRIERGIDCKLKKRVNISTLVGRDHDLVRWRERRHELIRMPVSLRRQQRQFRDRRLGIHRQIKIGLVAIVVARAPPEPHGAAFAERHQRVEIEMVRPAPHFRRLEFP